MKIEDFLSLHETLCEQARELCRSKGHDYSGVQDTLKNLKTSEYLGLCDTEVVALNYIISKVSRLVNVYTQGEAKVHDEPIKGTIVDLINYANILWAIMVEREQANGHD